MKDEKLKAKLLEYLDRFNKEFRETTSEEKRLVLNEVLIALEDLRETCKTRGRY